MSLIQIEHLYFTYDGGSEPVFEDLDLQLETDWKLGLVGRNGRGKTTLLRLLEGGLEHRGQIRTGGLACRRFPCAVRETEVPVSQVLRDISPEAEEWQLVRELSLLGLDEEVLERTLSTLSGGEQTRVLLSALFLDEGSWPMLDEPTDHLDEEGRELLAQYLSHSRRGFLLVSHDRAFLDRCVDHVLALNRTGPELVKGNFSVWYQEKQDRDRREQAQNQQLKGEIRRLEQAARRTSAWSDQVEKTKYASKKSGLRPDRGYVGHKSAKMMKRAKSLESRQESAIREKAALLHDVERAEPLKLAPRAFHSARLLELDRVSIDYGDGPVCGEVSFSLSQGERLCLEGRNGSGKTSLLRLILGEEVPHTGTVRWASGLEISYVSQKVDHLQGALRDFPAEEGIDATQFMTILRKLDFPRAAFEGEMGAYSAGQKKKVLLAASLCRSAHLYVWDEPLNFVDLFSRIQMEELLLEYRPTLLFVEHDEAFRERVATRRVSLSERGLEKTDKDMK